MFRKQKERSRNKIGTWASILTSLRLARLVRKIAADELSRDKASLHGMKTWIIRCVYSSIRAARNHLTEMHVRTRQIVRTPCITVP